MQTLSEVKTIYNQKVCFCSLFCIILCFSISPLFNWFISNLYINKGLYNMSTALVSFYDFGDHCSYRVWLSHQFIYYYCYYYTYFALHIIYESNNNSFHNYCKLFSINSLYHLLLISRLILLLMTLILSQLKLNLYYQLFLIFFNDWKI